MSKTKKKATHPSGRSRTYAERGKDGRKAVVVWLSPEALVALDLRCEDTGLSRREVVERMLLGRAPPKTTKAPVKRGKPAADPVVRDVLPKVEAVPPPGSPAAILERINSKGARRSAVHVASGKVLRDGKERDA